MLPPEGAVTSESILLPGHVLLQPQSVLMSKIHITTKGLPDVPGPEALYHVPSEAMLISERCAELAPHLWESWPCALSALWWLEHRRGTTYTLTGESTPPITSAM